MARTGLVLTLLLTFAPSVFAGDTKKATLKLDIKPAEVHIYIDEKSIGMGGKTHTVPLAPGRHTVKLVRKGVTHEETISLKAGENKNWAFDLGGGKDDQLKIEDPPAEDAPASE